MAKSTAVSKTLREYSEASSVHGVNYVFSKSLPLLDRLLWALLTLAALALAAYWSMTAYNNWQENLVTTSLKDAAKPVTSLPFPGVTICTSGLNMEAVAEELMKDLTNWKKERNEINVDREKDKSLLEEFMKLRFEIDDISAKNIFNIFQHLQPSTPQTQRKQAKVSQFSRRPLPVQIGSRRLPRLSNERQRFSARNEKHQ